MPNLEHMLHSNYAPHFGTHPLFGTMGLEHQFGISISLSFLTG
jgi:hypothetical protein